MRINWPTNKEKRAFTLVEIIVVLFIIAITLLGVVSLIIQNIQSQSINKNNIIAYQLAQEGVELVRQVRDTNWLRGGDFADDLSTGTYVMDYQSVLPTPLINPSQAQLYQDSSGFYNHSNGEETRFSREIGLELVSSSQLVVTVNVNWQERSRIHNYNLETVLYDWY